MRGTSIVLAACVPSCLALAAGNTQWTPKRQVDTGCNLPKCQSVKDKANCILPLLPLGGGNVEKVEDCVNGVTSVVRRVVPGSDTALTKWAALFLRRVCHWARGLYDRQFYVLRVVWAQCGGLGSYPQRRLGVSVALHKGVRLREDWSSVTLGSLSTGNQKGRRWAAFNLLKNRV